LKLGYNNIVMEDLLVRAKNSIGDSVRSPRKTISKGIKKVMLPLPPHEEPRSKLVGGGHYFEYVSNLKLHFIEIGQGPVLLLVNSWNNDWYGYLPLIRELSDFHIIALDLPGYGESEQLPTDKNYSIQGMAEIVNEFLKVRKVKPDVVAGLSMGADVVVEFGLKYPESAVSLAPIGTPIQQFNKLGPFLYKLYMYLWNRNKFTQKIGRRLVSNYYYGHFTSKFLNMHKYDRELIDTYGLHARRKISGKVLFNMSTSIIKYDSETTIKNLKIKTRLIYGKHDKLIDFKWARALSENNPNIEIDLIKKGGHVVSLERPKEVAQSIREFVEKLPK